MFWPCCGSTSVQCHKEPDVVQKEYSFHAMKPNEKALRLHLSMPWYRDDLKDTLTGFKRLMIITPIKNEVTPALGNKINTEYR